MVTLTNEEYKELLETKFEYELEHSLEYLYRHILTDSEKTKEEIKEIVEKRFKKQPKWVDVKSTAELRAGDKLRVKADLDKIEDFEGGYIPSMDRLIGKIVTVKNKYLASITIDEDPDRFSWDIRAFEREEN